MSAIWLAVRAQLRSGWRAALALVLLIGFGGGVTLAALTGARRSETGLSRFLAYSKVNDVGVGLVPPLTGSTGPDQGDAAMARLLALPEVAWAGRAVDMLVALPDRSDPSRWHVTLGITAIDGDIESTVGRPIVVRGQLPRPDRSDEMAINEELAARRGLRVGSSIRVGVYTPAQFADVGNGAPIEPRGAMREMTVAGIVRYPPDLLPVVLDRDDLSANHSVMFLTPAFWRDVGPNVAAYGVNAAVRLRHGASDTPQLRQDVTKAFDGQLPVLGDAMEGYNVEGVAGIRKATNLESLALAGFALLTGLATALLIWQTLRRQLAVEGSRARALRALGLTEHQVVGVAAASGACVGLFGAALSIAVAVALSPMVPIGVSRRVETHRGFHVDRAVLGLGALGLVSIVVLTAALTGWRSVIADRPRRSTAPSEFFRPSALARLLESAAIPVSTATGVRMALVRGRGPHSAPVATLLAGAAVGLAGVTAVLTFGASLTRLVDSPARYGVTWDAAVGNYADASTAEHGRRLLDANPDVIAYAGENDHEVSLDGHRLSVILRYREKGVVPTAIVDGREPVGDGEIALGVTTLRQLRKHLGDTVQLAAPELPKPITMTIVATAIINVYGQSAMEPGLGGVVDGVVADAAGTLPYVYNGPGGFLLRFDPKVDRAAAIARLRTQFFEATHYPAIPPTVIGNFERVSYLPGLLAAVLVVLSVGMLVHGLLTVVRRRRRELAVLKAMGLTATQVTVSTGWEATVIAAVALIIGLPLGIALGRTAWHVTARSLGVASGPLVPWPALAAVAALTVLVVNVAAAGPGWRARRIRTADALRSE